MSKDKKKKKDKKSGKSGGSGASATLKSLAKNPMVADIVASALVATASALRDSNRARALASDAADELGKISRAGAKSGEALWEMALAIGRRSLETLAKGDEKPKRAAARPKPKSSAKKTGGKKKTASSRKG